MKEINKETLKKVMLSLFEHATEERKKSEPYAEMFKASEHGLRGLLDKANDKMTSIVLDVVQVIEDRTGKSVDNDLYYLLLGLPLFRSSLEKEIYKEEGMCCSVDKAREIAKNFALANLVTKQKEPVTE